ncbi:root-specific lectin-like [Triticum dicoccoides]|uniref:Chitin-binding type-1 domain-containing protein n=4 Tax=Triticum TaxID=4564 RepID=A0A9R1QUB6_TRITD|nr:root-specific lectin-like [Triticum dicoccoides]XP_044345151.1 root-specific lectin-like [Triticum aestivum]CDM85317.1 unnamed protein product [Triticum aestivum]VAH82739.1 unnamed protein product [Triticum turgidum subsp. durum]
MMSNKALTLGAVVVLAFAMAGAHAEQCGHAADGMECPNNLCCSAWGYCGMDANYCGDGCQSGACYEPKRCGAQAGANAVTCPNNHCCSGDGFCGYGQEYCGAGCQNGPCRANIKCSADKPCLSNFCCSQYGYCGLGVEFCGQGCQSGACHDAVGAAALPLSSIVQG